MTSVSVTRSDIDQIEQKLHWIRKQMAGVFEGQQVYMHRLKSATPRRPRLINSQQASYPGSREDETITSSSNVTW